jgi:hypothetical protein
MTTGTPQPSVLLVGASQRIPDMIANQVQEAFATDRQDPARAPACAPGDRSIRLAFADLPAVKVTASVLPVAGRPRRRSAGVSI